MKLSDILQFPLLFIIVYFIHSIWFGADLEKNTSETGNKISAETKRKIKTISDNLKTSSFQIGSIRSASTNSWSYTGGKFYLNQCMNYSDLEKVVINAGFNRIGTVGMFCKDDVVFLLEGASRYENDLLCESVRFSYSWRLHENSERKECYENG